MIETFDHWVVKAKRGLPVGKLLDEPVDALSGVSSGDADKMYAAFGIRTIRDLAEERYVRRALAISAAADELGHDRGPDAAWTEFFAGAPLASYQAHPDDMRLEFGPVFYRGRLDGSARVILMGQDPAPNELLAHRIFVGLSGQRVQGFLRKLGLRRDYVLVNTYLYPVRGQFFGSLADISHEPAIMGFRNELLDRLGATNPIVALIGIGRAAGDALDHWPGAAAYPRFQITHPSAPNHAATLAAWQAEVVKARQVIPSEPGTPPDLEPYGSDWRPEDHEPIPRYDLPYGVPDWHGVGSHAGRDGDHTIRWTAP